MIDSCTTKPNFFPFKKRKMDGYNLQQYQPPPKEENIEATTTPPIQKVEEDTANIMTSMQMAVNHSSSLIATPTQPVQNEYKPRIGHGPRPTLGMNNGPRTNMPPKKKPKVCQKVKTLTLKIEDEEDDDATDSSDEEDDGKIYCVCRQPYNPSLWMIACDVCNDWYHGKCVQITATQARKIKVYVCAKCSAKTGKSIQYKTPKKRKIGDSDSRSNSPTYSSPVNSSEASTDHVNGTDTEPSSASPTNDKPAKRPKVVTDESFLYKPMPTFVGDTIKI
jgi:hypothetical protein